MRRRPSLRRSAVATAAVVAVLGAAACTGDDEPAEPLDPYFPTVGQRGLDVRSYELDATVDIDGVDHLDAVVRIEASTTELLDEVRLDLQGLDVGRVLLDGEEVDHDRDAAKLVVAPAEPLPDGAEFVLEIEYSGEPGVARADAGQLLEDGGGWLDLGRYSAVVAQPVGASRWLPTNDVPSDKAEFAASVTVDDRLTAVSNGRLVGTERADGTATYEWRASEPMAPYLMTLAVGEFMLLSEQRDGRVDTMSALPMTLGAMSPETPFDDLSAMRHFLTERFGPYPFDAAGAVIVPGMPPTALETQTRSILSEEAWRTQDEFGQLMVHELAHQWFGDSVTPETWADIWLNEGPAVYAQWLWAEHAGGPTVAQSVAESYDPDDPDLDLAPAEPGRDQMFGTSVYVRSAIFLTELGRLIGDGALQRLLRDWADEHAHSNATTDDFIDLVDRLAGADAVALAEEWLYADRLPELRP